MTSRQVGFLALAPMATHKLHEFDYIYCNFRKSRKYHRFYQIESMLSIKPYTRIDGLRYTLSITVYLQTVTSHYVNFRHCQTRYMMQTGINADIPDEIDSIPQQLQQCIERINNTTALKYNNEAVKALMRQKLLDMYESYPRELAKCHQRTELCNIPKNYLTGEY